MHENTPEVFKGHDPKNVEIVRDIVGIRPARVGGVRVEKEVLDGQNVVHAYGTLISMGKIPCMSGSR